MTATTTAVALFGVFGTQIHTYGLEERASRGQTVDGAIDIYTNY